MARNQKQPEFTRTKRCLHCGNEAPMKIVAKYEDIEPQPEGEEWSWVEGPCYELLKCPACEKVELRTYHFHSSDHGEPTFTTLYPAASKGPLGLPLKIQKEYEAALKVKNVSPNAYGVLMGRVLEMVCVDKGYSLHPHSKGSNPRNQIDGRARGEGPAQFHRNPASPHLRFSGENCKASLSSVSGGQLSKAKTPKATATKNPGRIRGSPFFWLSCLCRRFHRIPPVIHGEDLKPTAATHPCISFRPASSSKAELPFGQGPVPQVLRLDQRFFLRFSRRV